MKIKNNNHKHPLFVQKYVNINITLLFDKVNCSVSQNIEKCKMCTYCVFCRAEMVPMHGLIDVDAATREWLLSKFPEI